MQEKNWKKGEVIAAIAVLLFSALFIAGNINALEPEKGSIEFVLLYKDVENGDINFLSDINVKLFDMDGNYISDYTSMSNGIVKFDNVIYGNYVIKTESIKKGAYVYKSGFDVVKLDSTGQHRISGEDFTNITVDRYPLSHYLNMTVVKNSLPVIADVYLYSNGYCFDNENISGNYSFRVPMGTIGVRIIYNEGGVKKDFYKDIYISQSESGVNTTIDISNYYRILGTVKDSTKIVNTTVHIILLNKTNGKIWKIMGFNGGAFSFYLPSLNYRMVITADGYDIHTVDATTNFINLNVNPVENNINYGIDFSENMQWANITYTMQISNETILYSLPYNSTGVLYYQLKLLGWNENDLKNYMFNNYKKYTDKILSVDGNIYALKSVSSSWNVVDSSNEKYTLQINAHYNNGDIQKKFLLKDGKIELQLNAQEDRICGAKRVYGYQIDIPSDTERSNDITTASLTGYINTLTVNSVKETPVIIILKERKSPEIRLDNEHFVIGWKNMTNVNHVVNQSSDNYTVVIPAYKDVWFNASKMAYDVVRDKIDYENTTYTWVIDNITYQAGKGIYNITKRFSRGMHNMQIKVVDIGENTNETNITLLADNMFPSVNITIKEPSGKVIATLVANSTTPARIDYNISGKKSHSWYNWTTKTVIINQDLVFNESQEIVYDASSSFDTYDGKNRTNLPLIVEWNFNGNKSTGDNRTFSFDKPTRNGTYYVNITLKDSVNNTIKISLSVKVKDITKPVVRLNFTVNGTNVNEVKEEENVTLDASGSYDPENGTIAAYNWTIKDSKFKIVNATDGIYDILNGSFSSDNVTIVFHKYGTYYIILNVTDEDGNYNLVNKTLRVTPVRPDLAISDVSIKGDRIENSQIKFTVNVTNNGNAVAKTYWVAIIANGKTVKNESYTNLKNQSSVIHTLIWIPQSPGNYTVKIKVWCNDEPASYLSDNEKDEHIIVNPAPWKTPAIVIGVIVVIAVIGYIGWKAMKRKGEKKGFKKKSKKKEKTKEKEKS